MTIRSTQSVTVRYGSGMIELVVPAAAMVLRNEQAPPALPDPHQAVRDALAKPIGCPPLHQIIRDKQPNTVAITISDITRPVPNITLLEPALEQLNEAGVSDDQITIIIGTGMHRPSTPAERETLLGPINQRCRVLDHDASDRDNLVQIDDDPPVAVNRAFYEADLRIVTGLIEPHFMAGYSGGRKGVCPALVDLNTVQRFHGYEILSDPRSTTGQLEGNPCHAESLRVAKRVGVDFLMNVTISHDRAMSGLYAGELEAAHAAGVADARDWCVAWVDEPFDLVVTCGGGAPLDQTFYQTVKAMVAAMPAAHEDSTIMVASDCAEGIGSDTYTQTMADWHDDWQGFLRHIARAERVVKDQWQYQMHCRPLELVGVERLMLTSDGLPQAAQRRLAVTPIEGKEPAGPRLQQAIDQYLAQRPDARVAVVPDGPYTMLQRRA